VRTLAAAWLVAIGLAALVLAACGRTVGPEPRAVTVFAAISLTDPLQVLAARFEQQTGTDVTLNLSGSNTLATQVLNGALADVFLSADMVQMDRLSAEHLLDEATRTPFLSNRLVVITPAASTLVVGVPADLAGPTIARLAIGDPAAVPVGRYAMAYLQARGIWPRVQPRLVYFPHVRAVSAAVEQAAADVGFVYRTDARVAKNVRVENLKVFTDAGFILADGETTH
jgi:molybdate transport system substrate-binding protein